MRERCGFDPRSVHVGTDIHAAAGAEQLRGQVESIRVINDGWGKAVIRAGVGDGHLVNVTGTVLGVMPGSTVDVRGRWEDHPQYGRQFRATSINVILAQDAGGAVAWLAASLPGIGLKRAAECVQRFGLPGLWETIESDPQALTAISGITEKGVEAIVGAYERTKNDREDSIKLRTWGLTEWAIKAVREAWGAKAVARLQEDPYQLIEKVRGFGFTRADEVAQRMGVPADSPSRIRAALVHLLEMAEQEGHCFVPGGKLVAFGSKLLGGSIDEARVARELVALAEMDPPKVIRDGTCCYRPETHAAEAEVARVVGGLLAWVSAPSERAEKRTEPRPEVRAALSSPMAAEPRRLPPPEAMHGAEVTPQPHGGQWQRSEYQIDDDEGLL